MKKIIMCLSAALLLSAQAAEAGVDDMNIHANKLSMLEPYHPETISVSYAVCQNVVASNASTCINPQTFWLSMKADGSATIPAEYREHAIFIQAIQVTDAKGDKQTVWGPYKPDYYANQCRMTFSKSRSPDNNAIIFSLNSDDSITCTTGMG